jgi:hypothetical protein
MFNYQLFKIITRTGLLFLTLFLISFSAQGQQRVFPGWETDFSKTSIDLDELRSGGPPKDGIPSIDNPSFVSSDAADDWLKDNEPVILLEHNGIARAYPLQILIWHEIVNDEIDDTPILVTFCPLCYSAIVFDRRLNSKILEFGVSGFLRHSDMIMFDRGTESLWQQFTGEAVVGDYIGEQLTILPSQIVSYKQFKELYPDASVLSKETGHQRSYGENPYAGYDDINNTPFMMKGDVPDDKLKPMQKVIGVRTDSQQKAYSYALTKEKRVINDSLEATPIVIFHLPGANSALDARKISNSREDGSTAAFHRIVDDRILTFHYKNDQVKDHQTKSTWNITGKATSGEMGGKQLKPLIFGDYFAFAWLVFWPETDIYELD